MRYALLRRSFSAFPDGWPGQGLLLLRVTVGLPLVYWGMTDLLAARLFAIPELTAAVAGILLISGLFTPVAGAIIVLAEASAASPTWADQRNRGPQYSWPHWPPEGRCLVSVWSVDARCFGRKVYAGHTRPPSHSVPSK